MAGAQSKRYALYPNERYAGQFVEVSCETFDGLDADTPEVWLVSRSTRKSNSVCLAPEEAVELAKLLYKAAYAAGYKP